MAIKQQIDLSTPLSLKNAFYFPIQSKLARKELLWGAVLLLVLPGIGWILNMGHRIQMIHNMQHGQPCWPAWRNYPQLFKLGTVALVGMSEYYFPAMVVGATAWWFQADWLWLITVALCVTATIAIPGYMTHYCYNFNIAEVFNPFKALRRVSEGKRNYWNAWLIVSTSLCLSFVGLLFFGIGFLISSVWFWQTAGFSFARIFSNRFHLFTK